METKTNRMGKLAAAKAAKKWQGLRAHVTPEVWEALVIAEAAWLVLGQAESMDYKFGAAKLLIQEAVEEAAK